MKLNFLTTEDTEGTEAWAWRCDPCVAHGFETA